MINKGTIILIEEDQDDIHVISSILTDIAPAHKILIFFTLDRAFKFLLSEKEKPFLIISNNNWHNKNRQQLQRMFETLPGGRLKNIPFVFYSTNVETSMVNHSYGDLNIQGYFEKASDYGNIKKDMMAIVTYWERSIHPIPISTG